MTDRDPLLDPPSWAPSWLPSIDDLRAMRTLRWAIVVVLVVAMASCVTEGADGPGDPELVTDAGEDSTSVTPAEATSGTLLSGDGETVPTVVSDPDDPDNAFGGTGAAGDADAVAGTTTSTTGEVTTTRPAPGSSGTTAPATTSKPKTTTTTKPPTTSPPTTAKPTTTTAKPGDPQGQALAAQYGTINVQLTNGVGSSLSLCLIHADTDAERSHGLMGVTDLEGYDGMLFSWARNTTGGFWMKDTPTRLRIGWYAADTSNVGTATMEPYSMTPHYANAPYRWAVEMFHSDGRSSNLSAESNLLVTGGSCSR